MGKYMALFKTYVLGLNIIVAYNNLLCFPLFSQKYQI